MILMLNGAFGAGKTTLAQALVDRDPEWLLFDPEEVGAMVWKIVPEGRCDFQDLPIWSRLVVDTARRLVEVYRRPLVVPMTLVEEGNFRTIRDGFAEIAPTFHFTLLASRETLERRLAERGSNRWAFDQIDRCAVLARPEFAQHLDAERKVDELLQTVLAVTKT